MVFILILNSGYNNFQVNLELKYLNKQLFINLETIFNNTWKICKGFEFLSITVEVETMYFSNLQ